ncbi:MAG: hypothetical protein R2827_11960 [Bdellovibrionales bacterium]
MKFTLLAHLDIGRKKRWDPLALISLVNKRNLCSCNDFGVRTYQSSQRGANMQLGRPLTISTPLAGNPTNPPKYHIDVAQRNGSNLQVSDPRAIRSMIGLMDMQAVMGGAASHWGGLRR